MDAQVLIAGAGPVGLATALFLHERGVAVRLFDKATEPSRNSKALAVNPRTLSLLEASGVAAAIVAAGRPVAAMTLRRQGSDVLTVPVADVDPAYPMIVLPQARTERLLTEALAARGIAPERGLELGLESQDAEAVHVRLFDGDRRGVPVSAPLLFGADGAHSDVRRALGVDFPGSVLPEPWELADVVYAQAVDAPEGYVDLHPQGFVFALAFDEARTTWRYISTVGDPVQAGPPGAPAIKAVPWRSTFRISHRVAERLSVGRAALGGDAAHLHSPIGARGMNLGIEDAYVFAACAADALAAGSPDRIVDYGRLRHAVDARVVRRVELMTRVVRGHGAFGWVRRLAPPLVAALPSALHAVRATAVGLDHPLRLS